MSEDKVEFQFFGFRMIDRNENVINLSQFQDKDVVVVINCITVQESEVKAPEFVKIEEENEKKLQILCLPASRFFFEGHQDDESKRLICFLKQKTGCRVADEDGLTFIIDNRQHKLGHEVISYVGSKLTPKQVSDEIGKLLQ